jgi:hypothetical protein
MAFYIVRYNGGHLMNYELAKRLFSTGENGLARLLATGKLAGESILDQVLFPMTKAQRKDAVKRFSPVYQDFDAQYRKIHVLEQDERITDDQAETQCPGAVVVRPHIPKGKLIRHRFTDFLPYRLYGKARGGRWVDRRDMASVRVCKYWYVAINAVNVTVERPIIVSK